MKIFIYSDLHISKTSSILPSTGTDNILYTYRQDMIIRTGKYLGQIIRETQPDIIINLGDTFDKHTITSYDIKTASEFFNCFAEFKDIPHYVLVGNHEMVNSDFNAIALLNNIPNIQVIDEPKTINELAFLPYCNKGDILYFPEGTYLFSHQDIQGSVIRGDFTLPDGISTEDLKKYKLVFNGHIHKPSILNNVVNVGSITTHSFSDDEDSIPQCYVFDTDTLDLKTYKSNLSPLFRRFEILNSLEELKTFINNLDNNYKYILHITCPFEIKEQVKDYLNKQTNIINSRLNLKISKDKDDTKTEQINLSSSVDLKQSFKEFLEITDLKYPKEIYMDILKEIV